MDFILRGNCLSSAKRPLALVVGDNVLFKVINMMSLVLLANAATLLWCAIYINKISSHSFSCKALSCESSSFAQRICPENLCTYKHFRLHIQSVFAIIVLYDECLSTDAVLFCKHLSVIYSSWYINPEKIFLCTNLKITRLEASSDRKGKLRHRWEQYFLTGTHTECVCYSPNWVRQIWDWRIKCLD